MTEPHCRSRPLTQDERALLDYLLTLEQPGARQLREQALAAEVVSASLWGIEIEVPRDMPPATDVRKPVAARTVSIATEKWADITLWITGDGYIKRIQIMWPDAELCRLPRVDELGAVTPG